MEVRTKPTMYQRMLRSGLAVAFSAVAVFGAIAPLDIAWSSGKDGAGAAVALPSDIAWFKAPGKPGAVAAQPSDIAWFKAPAKPGALAAQPSDIAWNFKADAQPSDIAWNTASADKGA
ncbi:hypothetical protein SSPIM334S_02665 [Streptomyces spiroverticillatus]